MKFANTCRLFVAVCVLAGLIWILNLEAPPTDARVESAARLLPDFSSDDAVSLVIERDLFRAECSKKDSTWFLEEPITARADSAAVTRVLDELEALRKGEIITAEQRRQRDLSLDDYGFAKPRARLIVGHGPARKEIVFGCESPLGDALYAKFADSDEVMAATKTILDAIPGRLEDLRDKFIVRGDAARASRLEIQSKTSGFIQLAHRDRGWSLQQPEVARADAEKISRMLTALYALKATRFVSDPQPISGKEIAATNAQAGAIPEPSAKLEPYGLTDEAALRVAVWTKGDELGRGIALGKLAIETTNEVYAKSGDSDSIYAVRREILDIFSVTVNDLKDRNLYSIDPEEATRVVFHEGDRKVVLARNPESGWSITEPGQWKADDATVNEIVRRITRLRIQSFLDASRTNSGDLGFSPAARAIQLQSDKPSSGLNTNRLLIGAAAEGGLELFAKFENEPQLYSLSADEVKALGPRPADPLVYRNRTMLALPPENVRRITLTKSGVEQTVLRNTNGIWLAAAPSINRVNASVVDDLLLAAANLRAIGIESHNPASVAAYGLDRSSTSLTLGLRGEEGIQKTILLGFLAKTDGIYAMVLGHDVVFVLDKTLVDRMTRDLAEPIPAVEVKPQEGGVKAPAPAPPSREQ